MSKFKLNEVIKQAGIDLDTAILKLKDAGFDITSGDEMIGDGEVESLGLNPKRMQIDRRQDMLKKALERHKRNPRHKEIVVKDAEGTHVRKRLTKDELLKKKHELERNLKIVDERRERIEKENKLKEVSEKAGVVDKNIQPAETTEKLTEAVAQPIHKDRKPPVADIELKGQKEVRKELTPVESLVDETKVSKKKKSIADTKSKLVEEKKVKAKKIVKKDKYAKKEIIKDIDDLDLVLNEDIVPDEEIEAVGIADEKVEHKAQSRKKKEKRTMKQDKVKVNRIKIGENTTVSELAGLMGIKASSIIKTLAKQGVLVTINQTIDYDTAVLLGVEFDIEFMTDTVTEEDIIPVYKDNAADEEPRPPIVTVMGHVDHGKTSLLDSIRKTKIAEKEAGGITQHIGAYEVDIHGNTIVFLDTPGHEAFTSLRARGANVTDIVVLIVAADDGVMPQTREAIDHAKIAGVKVVVAINKIDKDNANPEKVKTQLAELNIIPEEWGGQNQFQEISAKNGVGIDDLLEKILLEAEFLELKADKSRPAEGVVIESRLDSRKGVLATLLVKTGTLKVGDYVVTGTIYGKLKAMFDYKGKIQKFAGPSTPVEVMGINETPVAGEKFLVINDENIIKQLIEIRHGNENKTTVSQESQLSIDDIFEKIKYGEIKELNIIIKADMQGSLEAIKSSLTKLSNDEVKVNIMHGGIGGINESDLLLASASDAVVLGFNVRIDKNIKFISDREKTNIHTYSVIYDLVKDIRNMVEGLLSPGIKEVVIGKAEIREVFNVPKLGKIGGCTVLEGKIVKNALSRVVRDNIVIYEGVIESLKRFKDDVKEVVSGFECGIGMSKFNDIKEGDLFEVYEKVEEKRTIEDVNRSEKIQ